MNMSNIKEIKSRDGRTYWIEVGDKLGWMNWTKLANTN